MLRREIICLLKVNAHPTLWSSGEVCKNGRHKVIEIECAIIWCNRPGERSRKKGLLLVMFKKRSHYQSQDRPDSDWGPTHSVSSVNRTIASLTINSWLQTASLYGTPFAERCWIPWNLKFKAIVFTYDSKPMFGWQNTSTTWVPLRNRNLELRFPHLYVLPLFIDSQKFFDELLVVNGHNDFS